MTGEELLELANISRETTVEFREQRGIKDYKVIINGRYIFEKMLNGRYMMDGRGG